MVGKKPTRSPTARLMPLRHARYSAMLSIVRIRGTARPRPSSLTPSKKRARKKSFSRPTLSWRTGDTAEAEAKLAAASRPLVRGAPTPLIPVLPPRGAAVACPQRAACSVHRKHVFKTRRKAAAARERLAVGAVTCPARWRPRTGRAPCIC